MRHYTRNSPEAAGRLLALTMISDGHVCRSEMDAVRQQGAEASLGLPPGGLSDVLQTLCEDLLLTAQTSGSLTACIDEALLDELVRDVDDPALQSQVVKAIATAAAADGHVAEGEQIVLDALHRCWRTAPATAQRPLPA